MGSNLPILPCCISFNRLRIGFRSRYLGFAWWADRDVEQPKWWTRKKPEWWIGKWYHYYA